MRIKYFTDKAEAAKAYNVQVASGNNSILVGPVDYVAAPGADQKPYVFDPDGNNNVYVLVSSAPAAVASIAIPKSATAP